MKPLVFCSLRNPQIFFKYHEVPVRIIAYSLSCRDFPWYHGHMKEIPKHTFSRKADYCIREQQAWPLSPSGWSSCVSAIMEK